MSANQSARIRSFDEAVSTDLTAALGSLERAAETFIKYLDNGEVSLWAASRDWFLEEWGRDTFISLPGLLLTTGRYDEARKVIRHFAAYERNGLIPNVIREEVLYNTADASLWFIHAVRQYGEHTGDWDFVDSMHDTLLSIVRHYIDGTGYERFGQVQRIFVADDGLVVSPSQASWMDADPSGRGMSIVTPRQGKCVEINALWYGALVFIADRIEHRGEDASWVRTVAAKTKNSFSRFWNDESQCLYDCIDGDERGSAVRPNQLFAITHGNDLLNEEQSRAVLQRVGVDLLTPAGLRTLAPSDPCYIGTYDTFASMEHKDLAYHQGTVWPWLMGAYCDAYRRVHEDSVEEVRRLISPLAAFCLDSEYGSLPEVFSGDAPYEPGGTTAQAWSVAEVLRTVRGVVG